tara:strand:+ start:2113 stop:2697 length:585 start_codon:yes stop_codon:yes gene_type:complete
MNKLQINDLWKLEDYAQQRPEFKKQVLAHKRHRKLHLGDHVTLLFEDRLTIQYQIQEMLRIERIFERDAIQEELDSYNPLIPDGRNWKATMLIEYEDERVRAEKLVDLRGVERQVWVQVGDLPRIHAIADEDMERENETKTSAVHFMRFELDDAAIRLLQEGMELRFGITHAHMNIEQIIGDQVRAALIADLSA